MSLQINGATVGNFSTLTTTGAITAPTTVNTINSAIVNGGALSGITTLGLSGAITGATATNTINSVVINAGAVSGVTTLSTSGDIYTAVFTDYTASSTVTGWASFTNEHIYYKKLGKLVFVEFYIKGTSNATTASFTLPFSASNAQASLYPGAPLFSTQDNSVDQTTPGRAYMAPNTATVTLGKDCSDAGVSGWTNTGTKVAAGSFFYEATA